MFSLIFMFLARASFTLSGSFMFACRDMLRIAVTNVLPVHSARPSFWQYKPNCSSFPLTSASIIFSIPATVLISVAVVKFFASFAHIRRLDVKVLGLFIDHSDFSCDGFSEKR